MKKTVKKAVYTFVFGDYDVLRRPRIITPGWQYICFTDQEIPNPGVWDFREPVIPEHHDKKKWAMAHKILHHKVLPNHNLTISIDASIQINCDLDEFIGRRFRSDAPLMMMRHPERACVYDEARACKSLTKDDPARIDAQMDRYRDDKMPPSNGLFATGIIGRRHENIELREVCEAWYKEVEKGSRRDQLSLPYVLRWAKFKIAELGWWQTFGHTMGAEQSFLLGGHKKR